MLFVVLYSVTNCYIKYQTSTFECSIMNYINNQTKMKYKIHRTVTFPPTAALVFLPVMTVIPLNLVTQGLLKLKKP